MHLPFPKLENKDQFWCLFVFTRKCVKVNRKITTSSQVIVIGQYKHVYVCILIKASKFVDL
jgi:hypothetical protein